MKCSLKSNSVRSLLQGLILAPFIGLLSVGSAWGADPFRIGADARPMGTALQSAFETFFRQGNYQISSQTLQLAQQQNPNEPLVYTLQAATAYLNRQKDPFLATLPKIRAASQKIAATDKARSHLYQGIAQGLEGYFLKDNAAQLPRVLTYASSMLMEIDKAYRLAPNDPEINLFNGFINMVLGQRNAALQNFQKAGPAYLALRGQALVYRDMKNYGLAQSAVDQAIAAAPQNPELFYLKGQILALQNQPAAAVTCFNKALQFGNALPTGTVKQIVKERNSQLSRLSG